MKRLLVVACFLVAAAGSANLTLTQSSRDWELAIDVQPGGVYDVRLTDRSTNAIAAKWQLAGSSGVPIEAASGPYSIRLDPEDDALTAHVRMEKPGERPDRMIVYWNLPAMQRQVDEPLRVGGGVKAPIVTNRVDPKYTDEARQNRISGIVIAETEIDKTGEVRKVVILKPLPFGLDDAAIAAVRHWRFDPATVDGKPVDAIFNMTVQFKVDGTPKQ
jgi:TonB family protein